MLTKFDPNGVVPRTGFMKASDLDDEIYHSLSEYDEGYEHWKSEHECLNCEDCCCEYDSLGDMSDKWYLDVPLEDTTFEEALGKATLILHVDNNMNIARVIRSPWVLDIPNTFEFALPDKYLSEYALEERNQLIYS